MVSTGGLPTPEQAAVELAAAEASRETLARGVAVPSFFYGVIGAAVGAQIATTAVGVADTGSGCRLAVAGGCAGVRAGRGQSNWPGSAGERGVAGRVREPGGRRHRDDRVHWVCVVPGGRGVGGVQPGWWLVALSAVAGLVLLLVGR